MPALIFLFFHLFIAEDPKRRLMIEEVCVDIEITEVALREDQTTVHFRKLIVKREGKIVDQVLLKQCTRGDYNYQIFDYYCVDNSCLVVIASYDQIYLYDLHSFQISEIVEICEEKYCSLIDAQSCAIFDIKIRGQGQQVSVDARDCEEIIFNIEDINFSGD